jgi:alpha-galactosidase
MDEKIVIIGAGSAMFTQGILADLIRSGEKVELALVDIDSAALEVARCLAEKMIGATSAGIVLKAAKDRKDVLDGATAVITTIGVGGRRAWEQDVFLPRKYGLFYAVGDTVGPGGSSRALRMVPAMVDIARDVLDLAPQALFINYANPMAVICHAVRKSTGADMIGLCTGTWDTARYLADVLGVPFGSLSYSAAGINHLTWFTDIRINGRDAMPGLREIAAQKVQAANEAVERAKRGESPIPHCGSPYESSMDFPFSWQCLLWFGAFPSPEDRHVSEFFPQLFRNGRYYGKTLGVDEFSFEGTISDGDQIYEEMRQESLSSDPLPKAYFEKSEGEQEQAIDIIQAIRTNQKRQFFANLPNTGQVPNLPLGAVVETPVVVDGMDLHPIVQKSLPAAAVGALATRYQWVEVVVEAALEGDRDKFIAALILDGCVSSPDQAVKLADELIAAHQIYLPAFR